MQTEQKRLSLVQEKTREIKDLSISHTLTDNFLTNGAGNPARTSDRYVGSDLIGVINGFEDAGFTVREVQKPIVRKAGNAPFGTSLVRMTTPELLTSAKHKTSSGIPEIVYLHNNNNRGTDRIMLGIFRAACSNGMILGDSLMDIRIRHSRTIMDQLFEGMNFAASNFDYLEDIIATMEGRQLDGGAIKDYIHEVNRLILTPLLWKNNKNTETIRLSIEQSYTPKRLEDLDSSLWTVFNRVQEYVLRGGIQYTRVDEDKIRGTRDLVVRKTRRISAVKRVVEVNKQLMDVTMKHFDLAA